MPRNDETTGDPTLVDQLASAYVLGTLGVAARRRFERLLIERFDARAAAWAWETRLNRLGEAAPRIAPSPLLWQKIASRLEGAPPRTSWWTSLALWRSWSVASSAAAVLVAVLSLAPGRMAGPDQVAVVSDAGAVPLWLVSADLESGTLTARAVNPPAAALGRVFELWVLPAAGAPRSLGVLPVQGQTVDHSLGDELRVSFETASGLAVSVEPLGGSPTGVPTGAVVYQAPLLSL